MASTQSSPARHETEADLVSRPVRIAAAWSWRWIVIVIGALPIIWLLSHTSIIVIPLAVALLITALLVPLTNFLRNRWKWPKGLALVAALIALFASVGLLINLALVAFRTGHQLDFTMLRARYDEFIGWVNTTPLKVSEDQLNQWFSKGIEWLETNSGTLLQSALSAGSTVASILTGSVVVLFAVIFYLLDGRRIWLFVVSFFPQAARAAVDGAGERAWISTGQYVRVQVVVALIDAIGIFIGAVILNVPYALAIGIIVFLAAFVPLIGAFLSGALAVVIALVANGLVNALIMLVIVVAVMAIEANILQPLIMGQAVQLHPLAVLLSVSAGSIFAGIAGAVVAVPLVAAIKVMVKYINSGKWRDDPDPTIGLSDDEDRYRVPVRSPIRAKIEAIAEHIEAKHTADPDTPAPRA
ncbi:AI-2E family transporter [Gulosibacter bifidus]|uniref:AI-2E family transporter n=1 Tax=Gulosibacter bifidus TaxID=272239 RepID=A0ABW5RHA1_9MICO|nr:AI-2E family transporter [Gulosibacter bifidus]